MESSSLTIQMGSKQETMMSGERHLLSGERNLLSPLRDTSPSNSLHSECSYDSGIVPSMELVKTSDDSATEDLEEKSVSDWGTKARKSWISCGQFRVSSAEENYEPEIYDDGTEEMQAFLEIGDKIYKDPPRRGENYRRFSTACAPIRTLSEHITIPEVVITSHDDDESNDECQSQLTPKHRLLRRSMSSPDGVLSHLSPETCLKLASLAMDVQEDADYVTLEDVERFKKSRRKKSGTNSITSLTDDRFQLCDETWSYTNISSSQASENIVSDVEETDNRIRETDLTRVNKDRSEVLEFTATKHDMPKISAWGKLRRMVRWIPFIQIYRKKKYPWVQLAGHSGNFIKGIKQGTVLKKHNLAEEECYKELMEDVLRDVVPQYYRKTAVEGTDYMELQCLLSHFTKPHLMDVKMGTRTFLQTEATQCKPRRDLYEKMVKENSDAPTEEEKRNEAVCKYRYLDWRDCVSSSRSLGFRIEGVTAGGRSSRDFKTTREPQQISQIFDNFATEKKIRDMYLQRLITVKNLCEKSSFFASHELIGSSLLFVHDDEKASVWMIDFEKTRVVGPEVSISHAREWVQDNHEDGYLIGLESLIQIFST